MKIYTLAILKVDGKVEKIEYAESRMVDLCLKAMAVNDAGTPWYVIDSDEPKKMMRYGNLDRVPPKNNDPTPAAKAGVSDLEDGYNDPMEDVYPNYMDDLLIDDIDLSIPGED